MLSRRILVAATISVAALTLASLFLYQVHAQPLAAAFSTGQVVNTSPGKVDLSPQAASGVASPSATEAPMLEVHIANNGLVLLRGARVISISGETIRVGMTWGLADFTWAVKTNSGTKFVTSKGEKETLADIQTGTFVTVTGMLTGSATEPTIDGEVVRE